MRMATDNMYIIFDEICRQTDGHTDTLINILSAKRHRNEIQLLQRQTIKSFLLSYVLSKDHNLLKLDHWNWKS